MEFLENYLTRKHNETEEDKNNKGKLQLEDKERRHKNLVVLRSKKNGYMIYQEAESLAENISIQTKTPLSPTRLVSYYEITIIKIKKDGVACIGMAKQKYDKKAQPGWLASSVGFHSDDAKVFTGSSSSARLQLGTVYKYAINDTVGLGVEFPKRSLFLTKNGKRIENDNISKVILDYNSIYPTIGLDHVALKINFGETPFIYNIDEHRKQHIAIISKQLQWNKPPPYQLPPKEIRKIQESGDIAHLKWYLIQNGYTNTLKNLETDQLISLPDGLYESLKQRTMLCNEIRNGNSEKVLKTILNDSTHEIYENFRNLAFKPAKFSVDTNIRLSQERKSFLARKSKKIEHRVKSKRKNVLVLLLIQAVVENVLANNAQHALELIRSENFFVTVLPNCGALLSLIGDAQVYTNPEFAHYLEDAHRQKVADIFCEEYLELANYSKHIPLKQIIKQLQVVLQYLMNPET